MRPAIAAESMSATPPQPNAVLGGPGQVPTIDQPEQVAKARESDEQLVAVTFAEYGPGNDDRRNDPCAGQAPV